MNTQETNLIDTYLLTNEVTLCPTQYNTKDTGASTKDTIGTQISTLSEPKIREDKEGNILEVYYEATSWLKGMDLKAHLNHRDMLPMLRKTVWFRLRLKLQYNTTLHTKRSIRRDKAKAKNSITKSGNIMQKSRQKRQVPHLPTK